jgi:hypothetical protein
VTEPSTTSDPLGVLRRVMQPRPRPRPGEVCEMCGEPIAEEHSHVASVSERRLLCSCRPCYLLFTREGAGARRLRAVPQRVRVADGFTLSEAQWNALAIPVDVAFLFLQSDPDQAGALRQVACYPSPAGATESELDLAAWTEITAASPVLADVDPDVEAVLVRRERSGRFACLVVPIDACYALVGLVRQYWTGFSGGDEVWRRIDEFFAGLYRRAKAGG